MSDTTPSEVRIETIDAVRVVTIHRPTARNTVTTRVLDELLAQMASGECTEVFACGTAAIVAPIAALGDADGRDHVPRQVDVIAAELREALLAMQERRAPDPFGWTCDVAAPPVDAPWAPRAG